MSDKPTSDQDKKPAKVAKMADKASAGRHPDKAPKKTQGIFEQQESWSLQAERLALKHPLIESLQMLAAHYGRRISTNALVAGLPLGAEGITPMIFIRAAERADLHTELSERSVESLLIAPTLPCILVLDNGQACVLHQIKRSKTKGGKDGAHKLVVQFPETRGEKKALSAEELKEIYTGYAFFLRPVAQHDDRAGPAEIEKGRDWFWGTLKRNKVLYGEVLIAAIMINLFAVVSPLFVMNVYDRVVPNNAFDTLWVLAAGITIVYIFDFILKNLRAHFLDVAGRKADVKMSGALYEQVMGMTMQSRPASAGILASNMKEFETLRDFFTSATMAALIDLPFIFLFIAVIGVIGGPIAFIPLFAVPLVVVVGIMLQKPLQKIIRQSMNESALKNAQLFETIIGLETIKMQAAEGHVQRRWEELADKASRTSVQSKRLSSFALNWSGLIQQLVSVGIIIAGVYLISEGDLSMGGLIACVMLSGRGMAPLSNVAALMVRYSQSKEALEQLNDLMSKDVERPEDKSFISIPQAKGQIDFQDVTFKYPGQEIPAVNRMSFSIKPGERVGIIGAVGSGKTTIERLLVNLYVPESGSVQIDGTDVRQIDPGDLRRNVGAVQQSPQLFFGSVRHNITMGHETIPDAAVLKAAEMAGVLEFLKTSAAGLDTQVGERGEALSGGQRQSVAIARALLYDPPILILDEPTASMDPASENRLKLHVEKMSKDKTVILITHKGAMLSLVDKLILLDHGKLVAYGDKDEVIRKLQAREYGTSAENTQI